MASRRARAKRSITNKISQMDSRLSRTEKHAIVRILRDSVTSDNLLAESATSDIIAPEAVTDKKIGRGAVGTEHLGIINSINSDSDFVLSLPSGASVILLGGTYTPPPAGQYYTLSIDSTGAITTGGQVGDSISGYWATAPAGYLLENGAAVSRSTYADLYDLLGTTYGAGNGTTTFNLPTRANFAIKF